jgi:hypothetical protein
VADRPAPRYEIRTAVVTALAVLVAIGAGACGSSGPSPAEKKAAAARRAKREAIAAAQRCQDQLGGFLDSLEELDSRLDIGLNYDEYFTKVGDIQVAYNDIPIHQLTPDCGSQVGVPAEKAFNRYRSAASTWDRCFGKLSCSNSDINPELQRAWSRASSQLDEAQRGLKELRSP